MNKHFIALLLGGILIISFLFYTQTRKTFYSKINFNNSNSENHGKHANKKIMHIINETRDSENYTNALTIVTAFFNIGSFQKGSTSNVFTNSLYRRWMTVYGCIENPVIFFCDNDDDAKFFTKVRSFLPSNRTVIVKVKRNETWAFGLESRITEIYKQPGYPQHRPNTVVPNYSMAMHAKYEVVQRAIRENPFRTKYFCWLDIGLFRDLTSSDSVAKPACKNFKLDLPSGMSSDSVAYTQVYHRNPRLSVRDIVYGNAVWVCGCYFVGERDVVYRWAEEYKNATELMLSQKLMSTDQQVIYSMFNTMKPKTKIQTYVSDGRYNEWFHLAYASRTSS